MVFKQFYLGCLAHASYLIGAKGEAAIVDPQRDVDEYIAEAEKHGLAIRYVIETHLHADFVSGHRELAERTGATIVIGREANAQFPHLGVSDGDRLHVGDIHLDIIGTPGHTPESVCILVNGEKLLTGDTLFIGDVGRPDLAADAGTTPQQAAAMMYDSLHEKLLKLNDAVEVYPAHGAGSLCGKNISKETSSTIGQQRRFNYALQPMPKEEFVRMMTTDLAEPPRYFAYDVNENRRGARSLDEIPRPARLTADDIAKWDGIVLDVRNSDAFCTAHVPGSMMIGLGGQYASWAGSLIAPETKIAIVADNEKQIDEAVMRLARVGLENARGAMLFQDWNGPTSSTQQINVHEADAMRSRVQFIDVRRIGEFRDVHAEGARHFPLHELEMSADHLDPAMPTAVICASGYRSTIATSILERHGFRELYNVAGGTTAWRAAGLPTA